MDFEWIEEITDAEQRTKTAHEELTRVQEAADDLSRVRREGAEELRRRGMKPADIGRLLGMSRQRASKILKDGPPPERAFLGRGPLIIAVGEKKEADKEHGPPGPAVAAEDLAAYDMLSRLARDMGLDSSFETVRPPGLIDTNRDNLAVICGPRLSPIVGQLLESDRNIGFERDEHGWYLQDKQQGAMFRSPMDSGTDADFAYLGRLPRLDGQGMFLYIAGIHAVGAPGAVHWLSNHLGEIYEQVGRTRRFSTIIRCGFEPQSMQIVDSERATPVYLESGRAA
ncbi:hypothetical protein NOSIN_00330 [Nocardiopsis sinuspersici]|uniref:Uncharacterized protein n=1 Tax=Nocardiopsis sinuspersici TaxID=501010 RepID=A0A1V3C8N4_9ACTN|nr:hypothetical protein NOSIN_00330 [Nocardiopsis sinuspersici]